MQKAYRLYPIVPLSFITGVSLKKLSMKISILFIFSLLVVSDSLSSSSSSHISRKVYCVCEYEKYQRIALLMEIIPTCLELCANYVGELWPQNCLKYTSCFRSDNFLVSNAITVGIAHIFWPHLEY